MKKSIECLALGVALSHAAQGLPALENVHKIISPASLSAINKESFEAGWQDGCTDLLADLEETGYWNFEFYAFATPIRSALPPSQGGGFKALHYKLKQLGARFFYRTSGDDLYTVFIDIPPDPLLMRETAKAIELHSLVYFRGEDDPEHGRVFGTPYMGNSA